MKVNVKHSVVNEDEYNARLDGEMSYYAAIEAKRLRGDHLKDKAPLSTFFPIRRGSKVFVRCGDKEIELSPLEAAVLAQRWQEAVSGAYVAAMMKDEHE
jgi:hypothetical protein